MPLFKYLDPCRADVVEHLRIRFTPANDFNDPFECLADTSSLIEHPAWRRQREDDCVRDLLAKDPANAAIHSVRPDLKEEEIRRLHRERYPELLPTMKKMATERWKAARAPFRILCLSQVSPESADAFLLWGHYTKNHSGLVVEFNSEDASIKDHEPIPQRPYESGAVTYTDSRPGWEVDQFGKVEPRREILFTKSPHWRYEQEFRVLRFAGTLGLDSTIVDSLASFPPLALRSVTFGVNSTLMTKQRILAACARSELNHVRIRQAEMHPDKYEVTVGDVPADLAARLKSL